MKSVIMAIVLTLLTTGCSCLSVSPVATAVNVAEMVIVMNHVNDTPQEHLDHLDRQLARLNKWCRHDEKSACEKAKILEKEKADLLAERK